MYKRQIVTFGTVEIRDIVRRAAKELGGDPGAGVRLEIPQFLQSSLKALESVSFALKKKHPNTRRNIKFDDERMDLVLDFCLEPSEDDARWRKIRPDQASRVKKKLGGSGPSSSDEVTGEDVEKLQDL